MQQLFLTIDDQEIEKSLFQIAQAEEKELQDVIMMAIRNFIRQKTMFPVKKLDPACHSVPVQYDVSEDLSDVRPFASVRDSAAFGRKLRQSLWERSEKYE